MNDLKKALIGLPHILVVWVDEKGNWYFRKPEKTETVEMSREEVMEHEITETENITSSFVKSDNEEINSLKETIETLQKGIAGLNEALVLAKEKSDADDEKISSLETEITILQEESLKEPVKEEITTESKDAKKK
jgi:DNA primase large subunit